MSSQLIDGLSYIHEILLLFHGTLGCNTVLLSQDGKIKIGTLKTLEIELKADVFDTANIAESILERKVFSDKRGSSDIKSIGTIMVELMEPATSILDPSSTVLEEPDKWRDEVGIKDFLAATQRDSLSRLKEHLFLPPEPQGSWLERHVFAAVRAAKIPWEKHSLT